ncbi:MAG: molybdate ABC transporter substrate-binding protein [Pontiellaceae bacterium]|jgi:molybdate transport system substrate-binding protein|nr:molybdate ABC transporter substrate-binding protein [Pontiellaceae bacterium]
MMKKGRQSVLLAVFAAVALTVSFLWLNPESGREKRSLIVFSAAGLLKPMDELAARFESEHEVKVILNYGGSGELLGKLALERSADVFVPADQKYMADATGRGWIAESTVVPLVSHVPAIAVVRGNPQGISSLSDLSRAGLAVAMGDPDACAIGKITKALLAKNGISGVDGNIKVIAPTVNQLLLYIAAGKADAAVIWEDLVAWGETSESISVVRIPEEQNIVSKITAAVVSHCAGREDAEAFVKFLASEEACDIWRKWGFKR